MVDFVRHLTGDQRVGHCGTLDPRAEGVLPLALGSATRLADHLVGNQKSYQAFVRLDCRTDTGDLDGTVVETWPGPGPTRADVETVLDRFKGEQNQVVPSYSAVRVQGRRLYDLARKGIAVERPSRLVTVVELAVLAYEWPVLEFFVRCSKGTYIRQLAEDIGKTLGVGGTVDRLVRTAVGSLSLEAAHRPLTIAGAWLSDRLSTLLVPWTVAFSPETVLTLPDEGSVLTLSRGMALPLDSPIEPTPIDGPSAEDLRLVLAPNGAPVALCSVSRESGSVFLRPRKVLIR